MNSIEGTVDDLYLGWLYRYIGSTSNKNPRRSFWSLANQLYRTPYSWSVPNDDNREEDGKSLRTEFLQDESVEIEDSSWMDLECSVLEMLIALARRVSFESSGEPGDWFWRFMENLGLNGYSDSSYSSIVAIDVDETLDQLINRTYESNGYGGLFPLESPEQDQRQVELWYQMSAYLLEDHMADFD